jgi:hypothetical protein
MKNISKMLIGKPERRPLCEFIVVNKRIGLKIILNKLDL